MISGRGETVEVRACKKCGRIYPLTTEYWYQRENGQFRRSCRACHLEQARQHRAVPEVKERAQEYDRQRYAVPENKERKRQYRAKPEVKERLRQYYAVPEVKERLREWERRYRAKPEVKEQMREWDRQYRAKPEVKERKLQYRAKPEVKERARELDRQYRAVPENKERQKIHNHKRRAQKRTMPVLWNVGIGRAIFSKFGYCCAYCGAQQGLFYAGKMSWDHYIPLKAGEVCPGTVPWNMVPACITCNCSKNDSDPRSWLIERFGKRQGGARAKVIEAHLARMRAEYGGEEPLTPALPPISGEG